jgi:hypothetical protein
MIPLPRAVTGLRAAALAVAVGLALGACGGTATTSTPSTAKETTSGQPSPASTSSPAHDKTQVVKVKKYGISFELPKGWITLDARKVLKGGGKNPFLDDMADRLGVSREQLVQTFASAVLTMSVSDEGAVHGFLDNVNTVGQEGDVNDDQVKLQLATIGAKAGELSHASSDAGDVTRVAYTLDSRTGVTIQAVALAVRTGDATVVVTVSSSTSAAAGRLADQIQASLKRIPGTGPDL